MIPDGGPLSCGTANFQSVPSETSSLIDVHEHPQYLVTDLFQSQHKYLQSDTRTNRTYLFAVRWNVFMVAHLPNRLGQFLSPLCLPIHHSGIGDAAS